MERYARDADGIFQDVDAFFSVEGTHFLQCLQGQGHVQVVVIVQLVGKDLHPFGFEQALALFPFR